MNNRREFLRSTILTSACMLCSGGLVSLLESCEPEDSHEPPPTTKQGILEINTEPELDSIGGAIKKKFSGVNGGRSVIIIHNAEGEFIVFAAQCTHKNVEIKLPKESIMKCPAHGSQFKTDGTVSNGQAKKSLYKIPVVYNHAKNELTIG